MIDRRAFDRHAAALDRIKNSPTCTVVAGGTADDARASSCARPSSSRTDPAHEVFTTEYFGPILGVHVYADADFDDVVAQAESVAPYALTGVDLRHRPAGDRAGVARRCASRPATSTSTTSRPAPSSAAAVRRRAGVAAPTTRPAPGTTCCAGRRRARSRRRSCRRPTTATRTWARRGRRGDRDDLVQGEGPVVAAQPAPRVDVAAGQLRVVDDPFARRGRWRRRSGSTPVSRARPRSRGAGPVPGAAAGRAAGSPPAGRPALLRYEQPLRQLARVHRGPRPAARRAWRPGAAQPAAPRTGVAGRAVAGGAQRGQGVHRRQRGPGDGRRDPRSFSGRARRRRRARPAVPGRR